MGGSRGGKRPPILRARAYPMDPDQAEVIIAHLSAELLVDGTQEIMSVLGAKRQCAFTQLLGALALRQDGRRIEVAALIDIVAEVLENSSARYRPGGHQSLHGCARRERFTDLRASGLSDSVP